MSDAGKIIMGRSTCFPVNFVCLVPCRVHVWPMTFTPLIKKLAQQALVIRDSQVPLHRVLDVLATPDGDVGTAINRYRDIDDANLRRALHYCAELLRIIEQEAGLTPAWERALQRQQAPGGTPTAGASASVVGASGTTGAASGQTEKPGKSKSKFSPEELRPFVDDEARGQVRVAKAYTDGASKGNPGESGIGFAIFTMDGKKIAQDSRAIGIATNNIAEYTALIECMKTANDMGIRTLNVISDSELMVKQVGGQYKIKNADILKKVQEVMALKKGMDRFTLSYVGREHNILADALSTAQIKKKPAKAAAGGADEPYRDFMGEIDPMADEGATE